MKGGEKTWRTSVWREEIRQQQMKRVGSEMEDGLCNKVFFTVRSFCSDYQDEKRLGTGSGWMAALGPYHRRGRGALWSEVRYSVTL